MKKKILLISIIILAIAILVPMGTKAVTQISTGTIYGFNYTIYEENGERYVEISSYYDSNRPTNVTVPGTIENYPVTQIGKNAFYNNSHIEEIELPDNIISIGDSSFHHCTKLKKINIPDNVTTIGNYSFFDCQSLIEIKIPEKAVNLGNWMFTECANLKNVELPNSMKTITNWMFSECGSLETIKIPISVTKINPGAFSYCTSLKNVEIPNSVTLIEYSVFEGCTSLETITIPNSVTTIESSIFEGCTSLTNVTLPKGFSSVTTSMFKGCTGLKTIEIPNVTYIAREAFKNCTNLETIILSKDANSIDANAFENCTSLKQIDLPDVYTIGEYAFYGCTSLTDVNLKQTLYKIGTYAFSGCSNLSNIVIPTSVNYIEPWAFYGCNKISTMFIPEDAVLGMNVFYDWTENQIINIESDEMPTTWIEGWDTNCNAQITYGLVKRIRGIYGKNVTLNRKETYQYEVEIIPSKATNKNLIYKSSNEEIFTIDENGLITPKSNGTAELTISTTDESFITKTYTITVKYLATSITIDKSQIVFYDETPQQLNVTLGPDYIENKTLRWETTDSSVAIVDDNGLVTPIGIGYCDIICRPTDGSTIYSYCSVEVYFKVREILFDKTSLEFTDSTEPQKISVDIVPKNAHNTFFEWKSTNTKVATVEWGVVTPINYGTCEIICYSIENPEIQAKCTVTVNYKKEPLNINIYNQYYETENIVIADLYSNHKLVKIPSNWAKSYETNYYATYTNNGTYTIQVEDLYGNKKEITFTITEIDDKAPNITIKQTYDKNTNTVKVEAISDEILGKTKPTWNLSVDKKTYSKTYDANGTYTTAFADRYGNSCKVTFTITEIDNKAPDITIKQTYDINTNTVKVEAISDEILGKTKPTWTLSEDKIIYSKIYNANGTYTTKFQDIYGNEIAKTFIVEDIEFRYEITKEYDSTTNAVKISLTNQAGLQATKPTWQLSTDTKTYSKEYTANGTYSTQFVDTYGNSKKVSFTINEIDDVAPTLSTNIEYDAGTNTVTVSVTSNEILGKTKPTWQLSEDKMTYSKTYNLNGTYTTTFKDIYGNEKKLTFTVDKIESKYEIITTYDEKTKTTTVNVINNYGMQATKPTWQLSADKRVYTKVYCSSGTYTTKFVDTDGVETLLTFTI